MRRTFLFLTFLCYTFVQKADGLSPECYDGLNLLVDTCHETGTTREAVCRDTQCLMDAVEPCTFEELGKMNMDVEQMREEHNTICTKDKRSITLSEKCQDALAERKKCKKPSVSNPKDDDMCKFTYCMSYAYMGCSRQELSKLNVNVNSLNAMMYQLDCDMDQYRVLVDKRNDMEFSDPKERSSEIVALKRKLMTLKGDVEKRDSDLCDLSAPITCDEEPSTMENEVYCRQKRCLFMGLMACSPEQLQMISWNEEKLGKLIVEYSDKGCER